MSRSTPTIWEMSQSIMLTDGEIAIAQNYGADNAETHIDNHFPNVKKMVNDRPMTGKEEIFFAVFFGLIFIILMKGIVA